MQEYFIESDRIGFSKWNNNDLELAKKLWGNKDVTKFISAKGYFTEDEILKRLNLEISNNEKYGVQYWKIFLKETDEFIGCCGLRTYDLESKIYEAGVHLLPEFWGSGIASEVMKRVIEYAFDDLKASNVFAGHNPNNTASKKMLTKIGFHFVKEEFYEPTGLMHPSYLYKEEK